MQKIKIKKYLKILINIYTVDKNGEIQQLGMNTRKL
jgi:hypothetical protein